MPVCTKIVPDTNIVIAASITGIGEGGDPIRHRAYGKSSQLFEMLESQGNGYLVPTVKYEAERAITPAVLGVLFRNRPADAQANARKYPHAVNAIYYSKQEMRRRLSVLTEVRPDAERTQKNLRLVIQMSKEMRDAYYSMRRQKAAYAGPGQRGREWVEASGGNLRDDRSRSRGAWGQLSKFVEKYPNMRDQQILAEVITFRESLPKPGASVMIASSDAGFFSPYRRSGVISDAVTRAIYDRFRIICDHPEEVFRMAGGAGRRAPPAAGSAGGPPAGPARGGGSRPGAGPS